MSLVVILVIRILIDHNGMEYMFAIFLEFNIGKKKWCTDGNLLAISFCCDSSVKVK